MTVLVGHDGSRYSDDALRWALSHASATGSDVTVARAWTIRSAPTPETFERGYVPPIEDFEKAVEQSLAADIADILAEFPNVSCTLAALRGPAANVLLAAAESAELLVLGPRGVGGFKGLFLGSVSEQLVTHAPCSVVVVRAGDPASTSDRTAPLD